MKTIILTGYLAGVVYQLLCTDIIKYFGEANREAFEEIMEDENVLSAKTVYRISSVIMFVMMIFAALIWPVNLVVGLKGLWYRIKIKYLFWKTMRKNKEI